MWTPTLLDHILPGISGRVWYTEIDHHGVSTIWINDLLGNYGLIYETMIMDEFMEWGYRETCLTPEYARVQHIEAIKKLIFEVPRQRLLTFRGERDGDQG